MRSGKRFEGVPFLRFRVQFHVQNHVHILKKYVQSHVHFGQSRVQYYVQFILYMYIFPFIACLISVHVHVLEGLICTCTKSHVQKILTNVQNHVQNSALVRTFFHDICTS